MNRVFCLRQAGRWVPEGRAVPPAAGGQGAAVAGLLLGRRPVGRILGSGLQEGWELLLSPGGGVPAGTQFPSGQGREPGVPVGHAKKKSPKGSSGFLKRVPAFGRTQGGRGLQPEKKRDEDVLNTNHKIQICIPTTANNEHITKIVCTQFVPRERFVLVTRFY